MHFAIPLGAASLSSWCVFVVTTAENCQPTFSSLTRLDLSRTTRKEKGRPLLVTPVTLLLTSTGTRQAARNAPAEPCTCKSPLLEKECSSGKL